MRFARLPCSATALRHMNKDTSSPIIGRDHLYGGIQITEPGSFSVHSGPDHLMLPKPISRVSPLLAVPSATFVINADPAFPPALAAAYIRAVQPQRFVDVIVVIDGAMVVQHGPPTVWAAGIAQRIQHGEFRVGIMRIRRSGCRAHVANSSEVGTERNQARAMPTGSLAKVLGRALRFGNSADRGGCSHMEDASVVHAPAGSGFAFCGVFDGHGGMHAAQFCRDHLHFNVMASPAFGRGDAVAALRDGFRKTEADLLDELVAACGSGGIGGNGSTGTGTGSALSGEGGNGSIDAVSSSSSTADGSSSQVCCGSTALLMLLAADSMYLAWLGDCRAVLCRSGHAHELTVDHSLADVKERARVLADGGLIEGNRLGGFLEVARALGDFDSVQGRKPLGLSASPDVVTQPVAADDEFVILGSDGLWGVVQPHDAVQLVRDELDAYDGDATMASEKLVEVALKRHVDDNVSAMVVCLNLRARDVELRRPRLQLTRPSRATFSTSVASTATLSGESTPLCGESTPLCGEGTPLCGESTSPSPVS